MGKIMINIEFWRSPGGLVFIVPLEALKEINVNPGDKVSLRHLVNGKNDEGKVGLKGLTIEISKERG
jgi:hypothetical protein